MKNRIVTIGVVGFLVVLGLGAAMYAASQKQATGGQAHSNARGTDSDAMDDKKDSATEPNPQEANEVTYKGFAVVQKTLRIKAGTTVTWTNLDTAKHDVTPVTETADFKASELFGKGETYQVTFTAPGKYEYYCSPHPYMKGTIEVIE